MTPPAFSPIKAWGRAAPSPPPTPPEHLLGSPAKARQQTQGTGSVGRAADFIEGAAQAALTRPGMVLRAAAPFHLSSDPKALAGGDRCTGLVFMVVWSVVVTARQGGLRPEPIRAGMIKSILLRESPAFWAEVLAQCQHGVILGDGS